jgi:hypothetical protein
MPSSSASRQSPVSVPIQDKSPAIPLTHSMDTQQAKNIIDRLTALEQQNAVMMNLLQTAYAQKMSDYETQGNAARGKMEELTRRMNHIEKNLNQITELLRAAKSQPNASANAPSFSSPEAARPAAEEGPRLIYTVQAIIPGRAWLKSESGDTVTVAAGDYLKGYGRVTKVDPYDGVVTIDTGKKIITLSYGAGLD